MTNALNLIARRAGSDFRLFCNGIEFGRLADCEVTHVYEGLYSAEINKGMCGDFMPSEMLAHVRKVLEGIADGAKGTMTAEQYAQAGMSLQAFGRALNVPAAVKRGGDIVEQACRSIRSRGLYYTPPVEA